MKTALLTTERLFRSGEFKPVNEGYIQRTDGITFFPNQIWFDATHKTAVLCTFQSQRGTDFPLGSDALTLLRKLEQAGDRVRQAYVGCCFGTGKVNADPQLISFRTVAQQLQKLNGCAPSEGKHGLYYWIDDQGDPSTSYESDDTGKIVM